MFKRPTFPVVSWVIVDHDLSRLILLPSELNPAARQYEGISCKSTFFCRWGMLAAGFYQGDPIPLEEIEKDVSAPVKGGHDGVE